MPDLVENLRNAKRWNWDGTEAADEIERLLAAGDDAACEIKRQHFRGLELAKALTECITAMNPPDRGGISLYEWNRRLRTATKRAAAVFGESASEPTQ